MRGIRIEETMHPLSIEEKVLAEKYHYIIVHVLHRCRAPEDTYYDIVVMSYLNAVQHYCTEPRLQQYSFTTIANKAVEGALKNHWKREWKRPQHLSLDADANEEGNKEVYNFVGVQENDFEKLFEEDTTAIKRKAVKEVSKQLTPRQLQIFSLLSNGLTQSEIAKMLGLSQVTICEAVKKVRNKVATGKIAYPACLGA